MKKSILYNLLFAQGNRRPADAIKGGGMAPGTSRLARCTRLMFNQRPADATWGGEMVDSEYSAAWVV